MYNNRLIVSGGACPAAFRQHAQNNAKRAFTLIELLVVILILSILAALIIPRLIGRTQDAKIAAAKSDIASLRTALDNYRIDNDKYPSTEDGLAALTEKPSDATNWKGPYLEKAISNDPWGAPYIYQSPGPNGEDFFIETYGPTGQPGGTGDNSAITSDD
jgi:general secretion pathway protein G